MPPDIVLTEDGSITCLDPNTGELYHNQAGAYTEAYAHYVQLCDIIPRANKQKQITILDACFGLGYNTFVFLEALIANIENGNIIQSPLVCHIIGIDSDPQILNIISQVLADARFTKLRQSLNLSPTHIDLILHNWQKSGKHEIKIHSKIDLSIIIEIRISDLRQAVKQLTTEDKQFDYIFHDGFSPRTMPELWTIDLFSQYAKLLNDSGRLMTYSSAYAVRGALKDCGLQIKKSQPLGRKASGTIAFKNTPSEITDGQLILDLSADEQTALNSRSAIPYRDLDFSDTKAEILKRRTAEIATSILPVNRRFVEPNE